MALAWHVLKIYPRSEHTAANALSRDGYQIFLPSIKSGYWEGKDTDRVLFPGYLFIKVNPDDEGWPSFRMAHRVIGWVNFDGRVPIVPNEVIEALILTLEGKTESHNLWDRFNPGDKVEFTKGALSGVGELIEAVKSPTGRAKILLEFMGRQVKVEVPWDCLQRTGHRESNHYAVRRRTRGKGRLTQEFRRELATNHSL